MPTSDRTAPGRDRPEPKDSPRDAGRARMADAPIEPPQYFDPDEPWDVQSAEALTHLYESGEGYLHRRPEDGPARRLRQPQPALPAGEPASPDNAWLARAFYIWLSVFNLLAVSVCWSILADLFRIAEAKRLFALMAVGASVGGLVGPLLGVLLVGPIGHAGLMLLSAMLLIGTIGAARRLQAWRDRHPLGPEETRARGRPLGGSPFAGAVQVLRSPFLLGSAVYVLLLAATTVFLYFDQARLVEAAFPNRADQTRVFGTIDMIVQSLAIVTQLFFTGRIAQRLGVGVLLVAVPLLIVCGFVWLAVSPTFAVLAVVMIARRAGEHGFVRPGREMLFTVVPVEAKYKAKNFIDTVVYRGSDALTGWLKAAIEMLAHQPAVASIVGAVIALTWAATGAWLARAQRKLDDSGSVAAVDVGSAGAARV